MNVVSTASLSRTVRFRHTADPVRRGRNARRRVRRIQRESASRALYTVPCWVGSGVKEAFNTCRGAYLEVCEVALVNKSCWRR